MSCHNLLFLIHCTVYVCLYGLLPQPCYLRDWELQVHFKIHGQGKKNLNGDGMALWYTKERMQIGTELALSNTQTRFTSQSAPYPLYSAQLLSSAHRVPFGTHTKVKRWSQVWW